MRATLKSGRRKGIWIRMGLESTFKFKATFFSGKDNRTLTM